MDLSLSAYPARSAARVRLQHAAPLALVVGALLALLAWAEVGWLPRGLPREYAVRVAVVLLPTGGSAGSGHWYSQLGVPAPGHVGSYTLPDEVGSGTPQRETSGQLTLESRCVELETAAGTAQRGALVTATLRGPDRAALDSAAAAWLEGLRAQARAAVPGLHVERVEALAVSYRLCTGA